MTIQYDARAITASSSQTANIDYGGRSSPSVSHASAGPAGLYRYGPKRAFDATIICMAAPFIVMTIALLALALMLEGGNPFYTQTRVGLNGKFFRMWKFRTMVVGADAKLEAYLADNPKARKEWDTTQKLKRDPRITRIGRTLRKTSLDELPQLWNVLIGDMSLVGPRPMMPSQQNLYPGSAYYRLRPGITGSWQVSKRNESSFAERADYDQDYFIMLSLSNDVRILIKTVRVVVRGTGY